MDSTVISGLYKKIDVWSRQSSITLVIYSCYELIGKNKFCVQSANFYNLPITTKQVYDFKQQDIELFLETLPDERSELYNSIEDAIAAHEKNFD